MTDFSIPRRQHPLGIAIISVQFLVNGVRAAWPLLIGITFGGIEGYMLLGIPILLGLILAGAVAYYWRFKYRLEDEALVVERGLLQRERLLIPFDRIQAIQLFQGPLQQLFGLTGLRVDTAGSTGNELQLVAIGKAEAESLRQRLASTSQAKAETSAEASEQSQPNAQAKGPDGFNRQPLVILDARRLIKVGLSQNHLRNAFLGIAIFGSIGSPLESAIESLFGALPSAAILALSALSVLLIVPGLVLFLLSGVVISLGLATFQYFRYRSAIGSEGVQIEMGLVRRNTFQVPYSKVHMTVWKSNWLKRQLGFETLQIRQAQASDQANASLRVFVPAMEAENRKVVEGILYPDMEEPESFVLSPVRRFRWIMWLAAWAPSLLLFAAWSSTAALMGTATWMALTGFTTAKRFGSLQLRAYANSVVLERGWFWRSRTVIKMDQLQGIQWRRNVLLERRGVGHITFHTAAGPKPFAYVSKQEAHALRDHAINRMHRAHGENVQPAF